MRRTIHPLRAVHIQLGLRTCTSHGTIVVVTSKQSHQRMLCNSTALKISTSGLQGKNITGFPVPVNRNDVVVQSLSKYHISEFDIQLKFHSSSCSRSDGQPKENIRCTAYYQLHRVLKFCGIDQVYDSMVVYFRFRMRNGMKRWLK